MTRLLCAAALLVAACHYEDGFPEEDDIADAAPPEVFDAQPVPVFDASEVCTLLPDLGDVGTVAEANTTTFREILAGGGERVFWGASLNGDQDQVLVELYEGFPPFLNGIVPGTYALTADQLQYKTCAVCVRMAGDRSPDTTGQDFMATAGTVVISEIGATGSGRFKATMTGLTFTHVTLGADFTSTPIGDGCGTSITSIAADSAIGLPPMMKPTGK